MTAPRLEGEGVFPASLCAGVTPRLASSQMHGALTTPSVPVSAVRGVPLKTLTSDGYFQPPEEFPTIQGQPAEGVGSLRQA